METVARAFLAASSLWALVALSVQAVRAASRFREPHSARIADARRAVLYNFTTAMLPSHKESVALHPISFGAGALLHLGVFASLAAVLPTVASTAWFESLCPWIVWIASVGVAASLFLLVRRLRDGELRTISVPDDFVAAAAVGLFLCMAAAAAFGRLPLAALQVVTGLLLVYAPLGKLRHAVFFFLARVELGRRLGWRGVYPPPGEATHG